MVDGIASSSYGAAAMLLSARARADFSLNALKTTTDQQSSVMTALVTGNTPDASSGRGQLLDISV